MGGTHFYSHGDPGPPLSSPSTGKGTGPGCFAVIPRFLVFGWKMQAAQNEVSLDPL